MCSLTDSPRLLNRVPLVQVSVCSAMSAYRKLSLPFAIPFCRGAFLRFFSDSRGTVAIIFAMTIVLSLALAGGAIDFGRWLSAESKTINAIDASILAGGRILQLASKTDADAVAAATLYYSKNKTDTLASDNTSFSVNNNEITSTTTSTVETPFLKAIGIDSLPVNVTAKAVLAAGSNAGSHIEVSMMLDTTGSMWGSKMVDLKAAAKDLIDIVVWEDQSTYQARVALAPFSYFVNVGSTHFRSVTGRSVSGSGNRRTCVAERRTSDRYTDAPPSSRN